jgi:hypothetical protein
MKKTLLTIALPLLVISGVGQSRSCLRIMPVDELTRSATWIGRVKVRKSDKANYLGMYSQIAFLTPVDVIEGDFTLKELNVLARSNVQCAEDNYTLEREMLVFLEPEGSLFHTVNFQFGQFLIEGEVVKGWRDKTNKPLDKPYAEVRKEIEDYSNAIHTPPSETPAPQPPAPTKPPPMAPKPEY